MAVATRFGAFFNRTLFSASIFFTCTTILNGNSRSIYAHEFPAGKFQFPRLRIAVRVIPSGEFPFPAVILPGEQYDGQSYAGHVNEPSDDRAGKAELSLRNGRERNDHEAHHHPYE